MLGIVYLIWGLVVSYFLVSRTIPRLIAWLVRRLLGVDAEIGRFTLLPPSLKNVRISKDNFTLVIDSVGISSSLVNANYSKLLAIYVSDVRIQKDRGLQVERSADDDSEDEDDDTESSDSPEVVVQQRSTPFKLPLKFLSLYQITCIHVHNVNAMSIGVLDRCLLQCVIGDVKLEGSAVSRATNRTIVNLSVINLTCRLLRHVEETSISKAQPCMAEVVFSNELSISIDPKDNNRLKEISLTIGPELDVLITDGFLSFIAEQKAKADEDTRMNKTGHVEHADLVSFLPEALNVNLSDVQFKLPIDNHKKTTVSLKLQALTAKITGLQSVECRSLESSVELENLDLSCGFSKIVVLSRAEATLKIANEKNEAYVKMTTFSCVYSHEDIVFWIQTLSMLKRTQNQKPPSALMDDLLEEAEESRLQKLLDAPLTLKVELFDVTIVARAKTLNTVIGTGFKHLVVSFDETCCDSLLDSCWCHIGDTKFPDNPNKRLHYWRSPFFFGSLLLNIRWNPIGHKVQLLVDCANCEWFPELDSTLLNVCKCFDQLLPLCPTAQKAKNSKPKSASKNRIDFISEITATLTNINLFARSSRTVSFVCRLDKANFETQDSMLSLSLDGFKAATVVPSGTCHPCVKSSELKTSIGCLPSASLKIDPDAQRLDINTRETITLVWTATDHLTVHCITSEILVLAGKIKSRLPKKKIGAESTSTQRITNVFFATNFDAKIKLSPEYSINICSKDLKLNNCNGKFNLVAPDLIVKIKEGNLLSLRHLHVTSSFGGPKLKAERESAGTLRNPENKAIQVVIATAKLSFPYKYNFAGMFADKIITTVKWLKILHRKSDENQKTTTLPSDLWIQIKEFTSEIGDNPFEISLHDNHELLEDEHSESLKRFKMLDAKVAELRKTHLHLPAAKVEKLYASLAQKNSEIYIKRSRQMYASTPVRTQLARFRAEDFEVFVLADPTLHGRDNVVQQMQSINPESSWPEEGLEFSTLWCRSISCNFGTFSWYMRDYPAPLLSARDFHVWGILVGAEQVPKERSKYLSRVQLDDPWTDIDIERSITPLKFYHDFNCDVEKLTMGYGPCWEPAIAEFNLCMELISRPSMDPSPVLPFWDKMRLLLHGRMTMAVQQWTMVLHASLDPYNTTEQVDYTWTDMTFDWTNAKFLMKGNLDVYVRTASKYDDCLFLHFPNLRFVIKMDWQCLGDPNDHHVVFPCAPDRRPEYSSNEQHDSYRAFRSLNLSVSVLLETKSVANSIGQEGDSAQNIPSMLFYSNTLKWLDNLKVILSSVTRPIRRGSLFKNQKPRKVPLSRHYKALRFSLSLHEFQVCYWMSFAKQRGFRLHAHRLTLSSEHVLSLVSVQDGLKHRPLTVWSVVYMNCALNDGAMWLQSTTSDDTTTELDVSFRAPVEKSYFLSLSRLSYGRETSNKDVAPTSKEELNRDLFTHRLIVHDLKGSWTKHNRTIAFGLFDSYVKNKVMRHNLSTEALKGFRMDVSSTSPLKIRGNTSSSATGSATSPLPTSTTSGASNQKPTASPLGHALHMLQKLISEADKNVVVFSEDLSGNAKEQQVLHGVAACQAGDVLYRNWLIELINSQVLLKGCETPGYVIVSASRAQILQTVHQPVWKERAIVSKTTWVGSFECMQYYATVDPSEPNPSGDNVQWLTLGNIEEQPFESRRNTVISDMAELVGSGQGVGGVVSNTVGAANAAGNNGVQLQRIVSRCCCQFFYVSYGESMDPNSLDEVPPLPPKDSDIWGTHEGAVDSFTLTHQDLNCSTNSLQYAMLLDIVNNLLLYVEPGKKEAMEKLQRLRFQLQLSSVEDQRRPILLLQNNLRVLISNMRRLEKEIYLLQRSIDDEEGDPYDDKLSQQMEALGIKVYETKVMINGQSDELAMLISCFKESQLLANRRRVGAASNGRVAPWRRRSEVCFKHAQWRLTETDGLLGVADIVLSNFLYSKAMKMDDSAEHLLELGYVKVTNCIPNQIYKDVLQPTELRGNIPLDQRCSLRVFCREKAPVGGISIKEHFEVNVVPLTLRLTHQFFQTIMKFCFPERLETGKEGADGQGSEDGDSSESEPIKTAVRRKMPQSRRTASSESQDDIEKMKERAEKNKMFLYIKIPELPIRVSYKGVKDKNILDVQDFNFVLPTLEYHNVTWTWLDLLMAMKADSKKALVSQAIKHKLQIKSSKVPVETDESSKPHHEDEKARLLMGSMLTGGSEKKTRTIFGRATK